MAVYYVPNNNSFWAQINNGTGLYGLVMSQLVKGLMNGVNKRHEAYIDKKVKDREGAQYGQLLQNVLDNRGTTQQTSYNPVEAPQYEPQSKLEAMAFEPAKYENSLNPNVFDQNRQKDALQNSLNHPMQNFVDNAWNNVEGRGVNTQTVPGDFTEEGLLRAAIASKATPDMVEKVRAILTNRYKNAADLADAQQRAQILQGMQEPQTVNQIGQSSLIAGKDMTNAYNYVNPPLKFDARNAGDRTDYTAFNTRTGEMKTTQGQPYGISAKDIMNDLTKKYIAQLKESGAWGRHNTPTGTAMFTAKNGNNKPITDAGYNSARNYGMALVNQLGSNDAIADQMLKQTQDPRRLQAMVDGAYGAEKISEYGLGMKDNPMYGKAPARLMRAIDPNYLNQQQAKEVAYYRKNYPKETANMTDVDIAKQFNFYNPRGGEKGYVWH